MMEIEKIERKIYKEISQAFRCIDCEEQIGYTNHARGTHIFPCCKKCYKKYYNNSLETFKKKVVNNTKYRFKYQLNAWMKRGDLIRTTANMPNYFAGGFVDDQGTSHAVYIGSRNRKEVRE